jgi:hypothetical protein
MKEWDVMDNYIEKWVNVIEGMNNSNTYKLAWGKAILECIENDLYEESEDQVIIHEKDIVLFMMKYYWNQTFFFNLHQGPINYKPVMYQLIEEMMNQYSSITGSNIPIWFDKGYKVLEKEKVYDKYFKKFISVANQNVSYRFLNLRGEVLNLYALDIENQTVTISNKERDLLYENSKFLKLMLNYKWAQLLETYNRSPRIVSKVESSSHAKVKRGNLTKFKNILLQHLHTEKIIDFYTGEILDENNISIDHVIPWSFMYSDDLWNLVVTSKCNNSSKSNKVIEMKFIEKLKERNIELFSLMEIENKNDYFILKESLDNDYVTRYYNDFKNN